MSWDLCGGRLFLVITNMAVLGFDPYTRLVSLVSLHPGTRLRSSRELRRPHRFVPKARKDRGL